MAPAVQDAVAKRYQPPKSSGACPGETACERFQSAAEPKLDACETCELLPTKLVQIETGAEAQEMLWRIERLIYERDSGAGLRLDEVSALEWELILIWDAEAAAWERAMQQRLQAMFEVMVKRGF